ARARGAVDPEGVGVHPAGAARDHDRLRLRPRGAQPPDRVLQVRGAGRGHQHRPARARSARGARARRRPTALVRQRARVVGRGTAASISRRARLLSVWVGQLWETRPYSTYNWPATTRVPSGARRSTTNSPIRMLSPVRSVTTLP